MRITRSGSASQAKGSRRSSWAAWSSTARRRPSAGTRRCRARCLRYARAGEGPARRGRRAGRLARTPRSRWRRPLLYAGVQRRGCGDRGDRESSGFRRLAARSARPLVGVDACRGARPGRRFVEPEPRRGPQDPLRRSGLQPCRHLLSGWVQPGPGRPGWVNVNGAGAQPQRGEAGRAARRRTPRPCEITRVEGAPRRRRGRAVVVGCVEFHGEAEAFGAALVDVGHGASVTQRWMRLGRAASTGTRQSEWMVGFRDGGRARVPYRNEDDCPARLQQDSRAPRPIGRTRAAGTGSRAGVAEAKAMGCRP